jgi:hypothetical protein
VQFLAPATDAQGEAGNRFAVAASQAGDGTLADTLTEGGNHFNLLFAGKVVHEGAILG